MKRKKLVKQNSKRTRSIRKGDTVIALVGNNKGATGTVLFVRGDTVVVQGLNVRKKHMKRQQNQQAGGIVELERPIHVSNVRVCVDGEGKKLRVRANEEGDRQFVYGDQNTVYRSIKKPK